VFDYTTSVRSFSNINSYLLIFHFQCKGAEAMVSVSLLYQQPTFDDNEFHKRRRSNVPSFIKHIIVMCRKQTPTIITLSTCTAIYGSKTSFPPCK